MRRPGGGGPMVPTALVALVATLVVLAVAGCVAPGAGNRDLPTTTTTPAPSGSPARPTTAVPTGTLPDLVGMQLQAAQDRAAAAGFDEVRSHDALGKGRAQVIDRDWVVCFSTPGPGPVPARAPVDVAVVRDSERCPAADLGLPVATTPPAVMPQLIGRNLRVAREALGLNADLTVTDALRGRTIVLAPSWKVCTQDPAAGEPYGGVRVMLTVVKLDERCPG